MLPWEESFLFLCVLLLQDPNSYGTELRTYLVTYAALRLPLTCGMDTLWGPVVLCTHSTDTW